MLFSIAPASIDPPYSCRRCDLSLISYFKIVSTQHLVFCGSRLFPSRGYLDYLATRNLSVGTNAYTTDDHTSYQITTAGAQGMLNVLGVFADHVLYPTLRDAQFTTEIYHLDGSAKHQGVVYCEMASRENTESDMVKDVNVVKHSL